MMPDKIFDNQAFFHNNSLNSNNVSHLHIINSEIHNTILFNLSPEGIILALEGGGLEVADINKNDFLEKNIYGIHSFDSVILSQLKDILIKGENGAYIKAGDMCYEVCYAHSRGLNGEISGIIGTVKEISADLQMKEDLKIHKLYFSQLFESSPEAIVIIDNNDRILNVNNGFVNLFNYNLNEVKGKPIDILIPDELAIEASQISRRACFGEIVKTETKRKRKDGTAVNVSVLGYPVTLKDGQMGIYWIFSDITVRKESEKMIRKSLLEKEMLLKEVHHRVKNNLQIIGSLLKFQTTYIKDADALEIFKESQNRIRSISLIHEKLYQTRDLSRIEFSGYIKSLLSQMLITFGINSDTVSFDVKVNNIFLSVDCAIPCGLIINELVTNSLKYAFPEGRKGHITIDMTYNNSQYTLKIQDDGIGIPDNNQLDKAGSLGLQLVNTLAFQLDAQLELDRSNGTCYTLTFSNMNYKSRI